MNNSEKTIITVQAEINATVEEVWKLWTTPADIVKWNAASDDWHTPWAENNLEPRGRFTYRMQARDQSAGFDFSGIYENIVDRQRIEYVIDDGRKVKIVFSAYGETTHVVESFEAERMHSPELQRQGWQAILDNFKKYCETNSVKKGHS